MGTRFSTLLLIIVVGVSVLLNRSVGQRCFNYAVRADGQCKHCWEACENVDISSEQLDCMTKCNEFGTRTTEQTNEQTSPPSVIQSDARCKYPLMVVLTAVVTLFVSRIHVIRKVIDAVMKCIRKKCRAILRRVRTTSSDFTVYDHDHNFVFRGRGTFGVCLTEDHIFITQAYTDTISVYSTHISWQYGRQYTTVHVPGMINPSDVLATKGYLYIPDDMRPDTRSGISIIDTSNVQKACIWKVKIAKNNQCEPESLLNHLSGFLPRALSLSHDGKIIITSGNNTVYIYDIDGNSVTQINLPNDVENPLHIIELRDNVYVVCQRPKENTTDRWHVCKMNIVDGGAFHTDCRTTIAGDFVMPIHMFKTPAGHIVVADFLGMNVHLLDAESLETRGTLQIQDEDQAQRPCRLAYDSERDRMLIAFHHRVGLYSVSPQLDPVHRVEDGVRSNLIP